MLTLQEAREMIQQKTNTSGEPLILFPEERLMLHVTADGKRLIAITAVDLINLIDNWVMLVSNSETKPIDWWHLQES